MSLSLMKQPTISSTRHRKLILLKPSFFLLTEQHTLPTLLCSPREKTSKTRFYKLPAARFQIKKIPKNQHLFKRFSKFSTKSPNNDKDKVTKNKTTNKATMNQKSKVPNFDKRLLNK